MSDAKELDDDSERPGMNRKPSAEIRCRLADNLRRYRYYRGYTQERLGSCAACVRAMSATLSRRR